MWRVCHETSSTVRSTKAIQPLDQIQHPTNIAAQMVQQMGWPLLRGESALSPERVEASKKLEHLNFGPTPCPLSSHFSRSKIVLDWECLLGLARAPNNPLPPGFTYRFQGSGGQANSFPPVGDHWWLHCLSLSLYSFVLLVHHQRCLSGPAMSVSATTTTANRNARPVVPQGLLPTAPQIRGHVKTAAWRIPTTPSSAGHVVKSRINHRSSCQTSGSKR